MSVNPGLERQNFGRFLFGSASALFGSEIFHFILPLIVLSLGYSAVVAGWCSFAFFAPVIGGKLLAGPIVERQNKRRVLVFAEAGRLVTVGLLAIALWLIPTWAVISILIAAFVVGLLNVFADTAEPAVLKTLLGDCDSTKSLSAYEVRTRSVQLLGPTIGGVMLSVTHFLPLITCQLLSLFAILFYQKVDIAHAPNVARLSIREDLKSALAWMMAHPTFLIMVLLTSLNNFIHPILYLTVIYNLHEAGFDPSQIGLILAGLGAGGIAGSFLAPMLAKRFSSQFIILGVNLLRVAVFVGFAVWSAPYLVFCLFVLKAVLGGTWNVCYNVYTIGEMPHDHVARLSSLSSLIIKCSTAAGSLVAGYSIAVLGSQITLWMLVGLTLLMVASSLVIRGQ